jgi:hypothetical protein
MTQDPRYAKRWRLDVARGQHRLVDAAPARAHVEQLIAGGASLRGIAEVAGVSPSQVSRLRQAQPKISRTVADKLLATTVNDVIRRPHGPGFVPKLGAVRRIQALLALGWRHQDISAAAHSHPGRSQLVLNQAGEWIARDTYDRIARAYTALSMRPGPSERTRARAAKLGYPPPLAWDDESIDDPAATPQHQAREVLQLVDDAAVERRSLGDLTVALNDAERRQVVHRLWAEGLSDKEIHRRTGIDDRQVLRDRRRLGLPTKYLTERASA